MTKPISLILLNFNTFNHTRNCIAALKKHCDQSKFDIVIADNGSSDDSFRELQNTFPDLIYIDNHVNLGFAGGNNKALVYSISQGYVYSLLLNTDTLTDEDIVSNLLQYLVENPDVTAVQPAIYWMHKPNEIWNGAGYFNSLLGYTFTRNIQNPSEVEWLTGCCFLIRNKALATAGLFNENFFLYYEDTELSFRLRNHSFKLHYLPSSRILHEAGASGKTSKKSAEGVSSPILYYYISRNHLWFVRKYGNNWAFPLTLLFHLPYYGSLLIFFLVRRRWKKARYLLKGIKEGLLTSRQDVFDNSRFH